MGYYLGPTPEEEKVDKFEDTIRRKVISRDKNTLTPDFSPDVGPILARELPASETLDDVITSPVS